MLLTVLLLTAIDVFTNSKTYAQLQGDTCEPPAFPPRGSTDSGTFPSNNQYIIPTMNFSGCGVVTDWTVVGNGGGTGTSNKILELQLFRPDRTQSFVFTKVTSSVVTTNVNQQIATHTFTGIDFTFSPGDVLGFYYPNPGDFLEVRRTNSFSTHFVLSSASSPTASVVTIVSTANGVPLMSVAVECCPSNPSNSTDLPSQAGVVAAIIIILLVLAVAVVAVVAMVIVFAVKHRKNDENRHSVYSGIRDCSNTGTMSDHTHYDQIRVKADTIDSIAYIKSGQSAAYSKPIVGMHDVGGGSPYLVPRSQEEDYKDTKSSPAQLLNLSEVEPEYHEYQDVEYTVPNQTFPMPKQLAVQPRLYEPVPTIEQRKGRNAATMGPKPPSPRLYESPLIHNYPTLENPRSKANAGKAIVDAIYNMSHCSVESFLPPSSQEEEIYAQMAQWGYQEIPRDSVPLSEKLGEGQFGEVYKADFKAVEGTSLGVAVKLVKKGSPPEERTKLLQEAATLGQFKHRHVVRLIGVVTTGDPKMMLVELLPGGDLKAHLEKLSEDPSELSSPDLPSLLLQFCKQVVDGLACLARKSFVHRDIAARNILLDKDLNCKISDFGMTRYAADDDYYVVASKGTKVPARWTAPEALMYKKYSTSSDVWSYGMLMYEIWSVGHKPFENKTVHEVVPIVGSGYCQPPPPGCPRAVYQTMVRCWNPVHNERPTASDILNEFEDLGQKHFLACPRSNISEAAHRLGAPLAEGEELYVDLQNSYRTAS
jgi:ephrin-B